MNNIQKAIKYIQSITELSEAEKKEFIIQLKAGKTIDEVFDVLKKKIQKKIDDVFDNAGVKLDENDPEYRAKHKEMTDSIKKAEKEFDETMTKIEKEVDQAQAEVLKKDEDERLQKVRSKIVTEK